MRHATVLVLALLASGAQAQKITPGLWEHTITIQAGNARMDAAMVQIREQMARMSPEQRKQMEAMMASRGVSIGAAAGAGVGQPIVAKVCITPEQAARDDFARHEGHCTVSRRERSGKTVRVRFDCRGEPPTTGEGEFTIDSEKAHHGRTTVDTVRQGQPERVEMESSGRWLQADCGAIQPRSGK